MPRCFESAFTLPMLLQVPPKQNLLARASLQPPPSALLTTQLSRDVVVPLPRCLDGLCDARCSDPRSTGSSETNNIIRELRTE
jgi:hypothetical protein